MDGGLAAARLSRYPRPARVEEYERAGAEIEALLRDIPGIVAIYRTGGISAPGISDIDLIAVTERGVSTVPSIWPGLSSRTRDLAMHSPFLVDVDTFVKHRWFAYLDPLERAWGDTIDVEEPPAMDLCRELIGMEGLVYGLLRLAKQAVSGRVKVRPTLCLVHTLAHDLRLLGLDHTRDPDGWAVVGEVDQLRRSWFDLEADHGGRERRFRAVVSAAYRASLSTLEIASLEPDGVMLSRASSRLGEPWTNVVVVATSGDSADLRVTWQIPVPLRSRFPRVAELAWRLSRLELVVPMDLSRGERRPEAQRVIDERTRLVRRYREQFVRRNPTYSPIGIATSLLP